MLHWVTGSCTSCAQCESAMTDNTTCFSYREKKEAEERDRLAREEFERQIAAEQSEQQLFFQKEEEKRRKIMERMKIIQQREAMQNFKVIGMCRIFDVLRKCITILTYCEL